MSDIQQLLRQAEKAINNGDLEAAETVLERAAQAEPENSEVLNNLGVFRYHQGRLEEGLESLERALELGSTSSDTVLNAAVVYTELGRPAAALAVLLQTGDGEEEPAHLGESIHHVSLQLLDDFVNAPFEADWTAAEEMDGVTASRLNQALSEFERRFSRFSLGQKLEVLSVAWLLLGEKEKAAVSLRQLVLGGSDESHHYLALARVYVDLLQIYDARFVTQLSIDRFGAGDDTDRLQDRIEELRDTSEVVQRYRTILIAMEGGAASMRKLLPALGAVKRRLPHAEITLLAGSEGAAVAEQSGAVARTLVEPDDRRYDIGFESVHWEGLRQRFGDYGHRLCRTFYTIHPPPAGKGEEDQHLALARFFGIDADNELPSTSVRVGELGLELVGKSFAECGLVEMDHRLFLEKDGRREPFTVHLVGARWSNFPWGMENELYRALELAGAHLIDTDFRRDFEKLPELLKKPAHLLWVVKGNGIPPELIRHFPGKSILWYQDDIFATDHAPRHIEHNAHAFDTVYSFDAAALDEYRKYGVQDPRWLPLAMSPAVHRKLFLPQNHDVVFVGQVYPQRAELLGRLQQCCNLLVTQAYGDEMVRLFNEARIVLNVGVGKTGIQSRVFEALGCGSFLLTNEIPEETRLFEDRKHLVYFNESNVEELVRHYLAHDRERREIADNGYLEVHAKHTFKHRVEQILEEHFSWRGTELRESIRLTTESQPTEGAGEVRSPRILVVGFDGMEANILLEHLDQFPTFKRLIEESSWGVLEVTPCPGTLEGWASIYTGCQPSKHGMDEVAWKARGGRIEEFPRFADLRTKTIWEIFAENGRSSACFNIPFVHYMAQRPNQNVRYIVPGYFVPPHIRPYPRQIWPLLEGYPSEQGSIISHKPHVPAEEWSGATGEHQRRLKEQYVREAMGRDRQRLEYCTRLIQEFQPEFSFNVFHETDRIGHFVLDYLDLMVEGYKVADQILARMMELEYDYLVVISDHGIWHQDSELCERTVKITGRSEFASGGYRLADSTHSAHAIFIVHGEGIAAGREIRGSLYDVTPTLCHLGRVPVPAHVDGRVLEEIFAGQVLDDDEQEHLKEQLAGLGYI